MSGHGLVKFQRQAVKVVMLTEMFVNGMYEDESVLA